jgi:hypothetical protein
MPETLNVGAELCRRLKDFTARLEAGDDSLFRKSGDVSLRQDIARYLASLPPHVADRKAALLLREALTAIDVADAIIAGVPEWTPVSERLPDEGGVFPYVLAKIGGMFYPVIARRSETSDGWVELGDQRMFAAWEITHWMPLPELPS